MMLQESKILEKSLKVAFMAYFFVFFSFIFAKRDFGTYICE